MQLGMIGLGRMGANMTSRLMRGGHECVVHDNAPASVERLAAQGAIGAASLQEFVAKLASAACHLVDGAGGSGRCGAGQPDAVARCR